MVATRKWNGGECLNWCSQRERCRASKAGRGMAPRPRVKAGWDALARESMVERVGRSE